MKTIHISPLLAVLAIVTLPFGLSAQAAPDSAGAALTGSVVDSATGAPVPHARICVVLESVPHDPWPPCVETDSTGSYRVERLPSGRHLVTVDCPTGRILFKRLGSDSMEFDRHAPVIRHWRGDTAGCDMIPRRTWNGVFHGHITVGFEDGSFAPCPSDAWYYEGDSLVAPLGRFGTWIAFSERARTSVTWPELPLAESYRFYVHVRGTVTGPGRHGHMGLGRYLLTIDSILALRLPNPADCAAGI